MTNFKVGQRVVCVWNFKNNKLPFEQITQPIVGKTYTIRLIRKNKQGDIGILLEEIINKSTIHKNGFGEQGFVIDGFRPLQYDSATSEILEKFKNTEEKLDVEIKETISQL